MSIDTLKTRLRSLPSLKGPFVDWEIDTLPDTPQQAFQYWLNDAIEEGVKEPHAMTLSTVDSDGFPDARVLILKNVDDIEICKFTQKDVVRHRLVQEIIKAYEKYENDERK